MDQLQSPVLPDLPDATAPESIWSAHKKQAFAEFIATIRHVDLAYSNNPGRRLAYMRSLRRQHHILTIADRIRRASLAAGEAPPSDLRAAAEFVIDKLHFFRATSEPQFQARTPLEEKFRSSARVHWHKLMRRAGSSPADRRGVNYSTNPVLINGTATKLRKLKSDNLEPESAARILRQYIAERLQHLLATCEETARVNEKYLSSDVREAIGKFQELVDNWKVERG